MKILETVREILIRDVYMVHSIFPIKLKRHRMEECAWKGVHVYVALESRCITSSTFFLWAFYTDDKLVFSW